MKRLLYQLFVMKTGRTEVFFMVCICAAFAFYTNTFATAAAAFLVPLYFIRKKSGFFIAVIICALHLFAANGLMITGVKSSDDSKNLYTTTGGTLVTPQKLSPGDIVIGGFYTKLYKGEQEGRFARGYNMAEREGLSISVPFFSGILSYRQKLADSLFDETGGWLRLTQAVVLGEKKYLENHVTDKYYLTGLGHLLAVSGLHVGLYGMVCYFLFGFLPYKFRLIPAVLMFAVLIPFTGFKIPVLRAGLIGIAVAGAKFIDYSTDFKRLLLFFAGLFILISPSMIADPSFLLSFSAVYGLLYLMDRRHSKFFMPIAVGLVSSAFIVPAVAVSFGSYNMSSVFSTPVIVPVLSAQVITFLIYLVFPSVSLEPLILLEKIHLRLIDFFADQLGFMFVLYKTEIFWALLMGLFLYLCLRLRILWATYALIFLPYLPTPLDQGAYFADMGAAKGFVVKDEQTRIFFKGSHGDYLYRFLPFLAELRVSRADTGFFHVYGEQNLFIPVRSESEDFGFVCVNRVDENCKAVYHTRSDTYKCDDELIHILHKNSCVTEKTFLLNETGDLKIENPDK